MRKENTFDDLFECEYTLKRLSMKHESRECEGLCTEWVSFLNVNLKYKRESKLKEALRKVVSKNRKQTHQHADLVTGFRLPPVFPCCHGALKICCHGALKICLRFLLPSFTLGGKIFNGKLQRNELRAAWWWYVNKTDCCNPLNVCFLKACHLTQLRRLLHNPLPSQESGRTITI